MDQPGKVANPARGQLNRENNIPLSPCVPENSMSQINAALQLKGSKPTSKKSNEVKTKKTTMIHLKKCGFQYLV